MNEEIKDKNEEEYFIGRDGKEKEPPAKTRTRVKTKLTHSLPAKVTAFFLMVVFVFSAAGCVLGAVAMIYVDFYTQSESRVRQKLFDDMAYNDGWAMLYSYLSGETEYPASYCEDSNIGFEVTVEGVSYFTGNVDRQSALVFEYDYNLDITENSEQFVKDYTVKIYLDESFAHTDKYSFYADIIRIGYGMRYAVYVIGALSVLSSVALFIFLMCAAGHKAGREDIAVRGMAKLPFDLYTGIYTLIVFLVLFAINRMYYGETAWIIAITLGAPALIILATVYFMNFAVRLKLGGWWKNTVIYYLFALSWKIVKALCRAVRAFIRGLPLVWKTALTWCALSLLTFIGLMIYSAGARLLLWFIANILLFPAIIYIALTLRKLQNASAALSDGNLSYQVDTRNALGF